MFPPANDVYGILEVEVNYYDDIDKIRVCSVVPYFSGKNLKCLKCMPNIANSSIPGLFKWRTEIFQESLYPSYSFRLSDDINALK